MNEQEKFSYIKNVLSRTTKKDYENYVVNAVYNRICDYRLVPITQQYVDNPDTPGGYYLIDLYFPQLNIGIECDEGHHKSQQEYDNTRELSIIDVLGAIRTDGGYKPYHIDVTKPWNEIEKDINSAVNDIKNAILAKDLKGTSISWEDVFPEDQFKDLDSKRYISTKDKYLFHTITEVEKYIFGKNNAYQRHTWYRLNSDYHAWFPKLAIGDKPPTKWYNKLSMDGTIIEEYNTEARNESINNDETESDERVVFARGLDAVSGIMAYRFVGVFKKIGVKKGVSIYKKVSDTFDIIRLAK